MMLDDSAELVASNSHYQTLSTPASQIRPEAYGLLKLIEAVADDQTARLTSITPSSICYNK
jgi:hypothetical protein